MKSLSKNEMLNFILETVKRERISIYSISKGTKITQSAIANIINGTTKNPHALNVQALYDYLYEEHGSSNSIEKDQVLHKVENNQSDDNALELSESDLDRILNLKIARIVKQLTDEKFNEINESLLFLLRKSLDVEITNTDKPKNIIDKAD